VGVGVGVCVCVCKCVCLRERERERVRVVLFTSVSCMYSCFCLVTSCYIMLHHVLPVLVDAVDNCVFCPLLGTVAVFTQHNVCVNEGDRCLALEY